MRVSEVVAHLERSLPLRLAADWDNVGLLLGDRESTVQRIMTCLTVTPESAAEAIEKKADLIVSHHPILFKAVRRLNADHPEGRMLLSLARAGIAVYCPHTAFDNAAGGINDQLAGMLSLDRVKPLRPSKSIKQIKIVVFVPDSDLARVSQALFDAGAGRIGEYGECSFRLAGTGTFHGSDAANPTVGVKGRREEVSEWRLEVVCPESAVNEVVAAMRKAHSYEEPAFDLYPLAQLPLGVGDGRIGQLPAVKSLGDLAREIRQALQCGPVQVVGDLAGPVQRVAIVCGAGGELMPDALRARADVFLTGEMRFHDYLQARSQGLSLILPGHYATERIGVENLARQMQSTWPKQEVWPSATESDPVSWV